MEHYSEVNLTEIIGILRRRKVTFIVLFIIVFSAALIGTSFIAPTYKASAKMFIQNENSLFPPGLVSVTNDDKIFMNTQKEIIISSFIVNKAIKEAEEKRLIKQVDSAKLTKKITSNYIEDSNILEVNVYLNNPKEAVELVNAIARAFLSYHRENKIELVNKNIDIVNKDVAGLLVTIEDFKSQLQEFGDKEQLSLYRTKIPYYVNNILELNKKNIELQADIDKMNTELLKTKKAIIGQKLETFYPLNVYGAYGNMAGVNPTASITSVPWVSDIKRKISDAQYNLSRLLVMYSESHPEIIGTRNQIIQLKGDLNDELTGIVSTYSDYYNSHVQFLENQKKANELEKLRYEAELGKISKNLNTAASRQIEFDVLFKIYDTVQGIYATYLRKQNELQVLKGQLSDSKLNNIKIFELASLPLAAVAPNFTLSLLIGLCAGILIGVSGSLMEEKKALSKTGRKAPCPLVTDRRSMARISKSLEVMYELKEKSDQSKHFAVVENISGTGLNIRLKECLPKDSELSIELRITEKDVVCAIARVVWIKPADTKDTFFAALHFIKISDRAREKLINYFYGEHYLAKAVGIGLSYEETV